MVSEQFLNGPERRNGAQPEDPTLCLQHISTLEFRIQPDSLQACRLLIHLLCPGLHCLGRGTQNQAGTWAQLWRLPLK